MNSALRIIAVVRHLNRHRTVRRGPGARTFRVLMPLAASDGMVGAPHLVHPMKIRDDGAGIGNGVRRPSPAYRPVADASLLFSKGREDIVEERDEPIILCPIAFFRGPQHGLQSQEKDFGQHGSLRVRQAFHRLLSAFPARRFKPEEVKIASSPLTASGSVVRGYPEVPRNLPHHPDSGAVLRRFGAIHPAQPKEGSVVGVAIYAAAAGMPLSA
jgi:hypothetical protein